jgi:hypothetical protein
MSRRLAATIASLALGGSILASVATIGVAQDDGTGAAPIPPPTDCVLVPARAEVVVPASPGASPVASPVAPESTPSDPIPVASPIASPGDEVAGTPVTVATPVVDEAAASDPNAAVLAELQATANSIFACLNERNFETYAAFTSDAFRGRMFGSNEPLPASQFVPLAETLPDVDSRILTFDNLQVIDPDTVAVDITYVTANQVVGATWTFIHGRVQGLQSWILDREVPQPVRAPEGAGMILVTFNDSSFSLQPDTVTGPDVVLALNNPTGEDHEALVVRLDNGVESSALLQGGAGFPEGVTFVGQATVLAGGEGTLVLSGLEPGTYTLVDLLPDANGLPHLSSGMEATFTVS